MMQDSGEKTLQCGICLEEQPEDCIASHQEMCMVRLVFQCTHCNGDFLSKEGLWNHLDMHEVTDESKHFNYQEVKIRHKLHKCDLCNDQRAYSESSYWNHVHEVHSWILQMHTSGSLPISAEQNISNPVHLNPLEGQQNDITKETNGDLPTLSADSEMSSNLRAVIESDTNVTEIITEVDATVGDRVESLESDFAEEDYDMASPTSSEADDYPSKIKHKLKLKCPHCPKELRKDSFSSHVTICEQKKFACKTCHAKFATKGYLAKHMKRGHVINKTNVPKSTTRETRCPRKKILDSKSNEDSAAKLIEVNETSNVAEEVLAKKSQKLVENPLICPHCGKASTNLSSAASHINVHKPIWCNICNITFHGRMAAYYHKSKKHTEPLYECDKCSRNFFEQSKLKCHKRNCKGVRNNTKTKNQTANDDLDTQMKIEVEETQLIPCESTKKSSTIDDCPEVNQYDKRREAGTSTHEDTSLLGAEPKLCKENGPGVVKVNPDSEKSYIKCSYCKDMLPDHFAITKHILYKHVPAPCDTCGLTLVNLIRLTYHKRTVHFKPKYNCQTCSRKFISMKSYENHSLLCEKKDVSCDVCGRELKNPASLRRHAGWCQPQRKIRNKLSKLKCPDCGKVLRGAEALRKHRSVHHSKFNCDICGITIVGKIKCKLHMYTMHTSKYFQCTNCSKIFISKSVFEAHVPKCAKRNLSCNICWQKFKNSGSLRRHRFRAHSGKNPTVENIRVFEDTEAEKQNAVGEMQPDKPVSDCGSSSALQTILKHHGDSQLDVSEDETNFTSPQDENITIEMDIKVEDTVLQ